MQRYAKAAIVGAVIGAGVGAMYAIVLVSYRDQLAARKAASTTPAEETGETAVLTVETAEEPSGKDRIAAANRQRIARAREVRAENPDMSWPEAMKAAANGAVHEETHASENE